MVGKTRSVPPYFAVTLTASEIVRYVRNIRISKALLRIDLVAKQTSLSANGCIDNW